MKKGAGWALAALLAAFAVFYFSLLSSRALSDPSEARYAEIPREMNESGGYVVPRLNYVKYFEKPPLGYWMTAAGLKTFGNNEFGARFPTALLALLGLAGAFLLGRLMFGGRAGLLSTAVLGTSLGYAGYAQIPELDMALSFFVLAGLGLWYAGLEGGLGGGGVLLGYAALSLGCLVKGPVAVVLPGAVAVAYLTLSGQWRRWKELRLFPGLALFLLITAPWFAAICAKEPGFARFFFIHEHLQRFATQVHHRTAPFWFFAPILVLGLFPWSLALPWTFAGLRRSDPRFKATLFLTLWAVVIFVFFSLSQSKRPPYILPVFAPLAILIGAWWDKRFEGGSIRAPIFGFAVLAAALGAALPLVPKYIDPATPPLAWAALALPLVLGAAFAAVFAWRGRARGAFAALALASAAFFASVCVQLKAWDGVASCKPLAAALLSEYKPGEKVVCWHTHYDVHLQSLSFYTGLRIRVLADPGELAFGAGELSAAEKAEWFPDDEAFHAAFKGPGRVYALLPEAALGDFQARVGAPVYARPGDFQSLKFVSNQPFKTSEARP